MIRAAIAIAVFVLRRAAGFPGSIPTISISGSRRVHVIAVISWMAGMLYLPRLFVYHAEAGPGTPQSETFKVMEKRLLRAIINPAMIVDLARRVCGSPGKASASWAAGCTPRSAWSC